MLERVQDLTVAEVLHLIDEGLRPKFIDARDPLDWLDWQASAVRIPGAIHVPLRPRTNTSRRFDDSAPTRVRRQVAAARDRPS